METKKTLRIISLSVITILFCALLAIIAHAILPAKVDESRLDGIPVKILGFPCVAVLYFIILYTHCAVIINLLRNDSRNTGFKGGIYFGVILALLYITGMQEIMLAVSPFDIWNLKFIIYQLSMGLGDAIPVIVLCSVIGSLAIVNPKKSQIKNTRKAGIIFFFTVITGTMRTILSLTNVIDNYIYSYPAAVTIWNYGFGFVLGISYVILEKHYANPQKWMIWGTAINWIIFNSFIGLIRHGALFDALLRSTLDGIAIAGIVWGTSSAKTAAS
ncbi:MAG: hypothetical protein RBT69_05985 [Spirochaetia bacterium]|jgi:hypothetical protein|nr:hypothetical protein [Spirochaetia bacterium]